MPNKVTIQDIADALNLSRNTVSKAINNTGVLADSTRKKVLQKAIEMGYKQFSYANTLTDIINPPISKEKLGEVALFMGSFLSPSHFASTMLDKLQNELSLLGYTLTMHRVTAQNLKNKELPSSFNGKKTKSIVVIEIFDQEYCQFLCDKTIPVLFIDAPSKTYYKQINADILMMDNTANIFTLIGDMKKKGFRNIGFIGEINHCRSFLERYLAFRNAMLINGLPIDEGFCITELHKENSEEYFDKEYENALIDKIKSLEKLPDLFICANDFVAIDLVKILKKLEISVPNQVKLFGFDDSSESKIMSLSTCHIHSQSIGYSAANMIITRINQPEIDYRTVYVATDLIYRDSTGNK